MVPHWPREAQKNPPHAGRVARILATTLTRGTAWTQKRSAPRGRPTGNRRRPWRQRSRRLLGGSGVSREAPAPFCERPEVKLLRPTRHALPWVLDVTFREDECRIRTDHAPANFTTIKHMALNLTRTAPGKDSLRLRRKVAAWDDEYLPSLIAA